MEKSNKRLIAAWLLSLFLLPSAAYTQAQFELEQENDLFSLSADNAALSGIVLRLSEITQIPMNIAEAQDTQVTLSLDEYTLESLIAELSSSSMIVRKEINGEEVISEVVFMLGSEANDVAAAALPSGEPNEGIIAGDENSLPIDEAEPVTEEIPVTDADPEAPQRPEEPGEEPEIDTGEPEQPATQ